MRDAFLSALNQLAENNPAVMLINGDLGFKVLDEYIARFPDQYINAGIAEQNMTAIACGLALTGAKAYTYSIGNFPTLRCLEQIRNDVCYHQADVTVVSIGAGLSYGPLGMSHFATEDLAIMRALPGMTVVVPSDPWQAHALAIQLYERGGPAYLRIDKSEAGLKAGPVQLGKARQVRPGDDAVIFATGGILGEALAVADLLAKEGAAIRVVDVHTIKPLDVEAVCEAASACGRVLTLEEHSVIGGLGGAIAEACVEGGVALKAFRRMGLADLFPEVVGDQAYLRRHLGIDAQAVSVVLRDMLAR